MKYDFKLIEKKWQKIWEDEGAFLTDNNSLKPKKYVLDMFPYPSGDGLHVGHVKIYTGSDVAARYWRMKGWNVLHPMGWDAFGLPTENSAIKFGVHPRELTRDNTDRFRQQMKMMGWSYDWEREINTTDPNYFKWTQWIFIKLFERGLAYQDTRPINWCPSCKTGLANEEVIEGVCERCGTQVEQKMLRQWLLKITDYAEQLLGGLDDLKWPKFILELQKSWIGKSEGSRIRFEVSGRKEQIEVFTTRPETIYGVTYLVLAPEHEAVEELVKVSENATEAERYIDNSLKKTERQRQQDEKIKTGVVLKGVMSINPANGEDLPIYIADYVLGSYGTGAIMAVPAHDARDFEFAKKFDLLIKQVIEDDPINELPFEGKGMLINSGEFSGLDSDEAKQAITDRIGGEIETQFKLRDWVFSRQRYWGEPIPVIHCEKCGVVPVPDEDLPVELPEIEQYEPTGTGESPLATIDEWVNVKCPKCSGQAKRETNTMPQWAGSSWYWLRYLDPKNSKELADQQVLEKWLPVDLYVGGAEHAVLHLLYARFWNLVLHEEQVVTEAEPFRELRNVGLVLGSDNQKMSKSRGNVVNPDDEVEKFGADAVRVFACFMSPFDGSSAWSTEGLIGAQRWLKRVAEFSEREFVDDSDEVKRVMAKTIKRVSDGVKEFKFNTSVAALMELLNLFEKSEVSRKSWEVYLKLLSPLAPHLAEELWSQIHDDGLVMHSDWPEASEEDLQNELVKIPVQVNGKVRGEIELSAGASLEEAEAVARELDNVMKYLEDQEVRKVIFVENKMLNFVV